MTHSHPTRLLCGPTDSECRTCAWAKNSDEQWFCFAAHVESQPITICPSWLGCELWEKVIISCDNCGACCREAYDSVPVSDHDLARIADTDRWVQIHEDGWRDLYRSPSPSNLGGSRCKALNGGRSEDKAFHCEIYMERPTNCRELAIGSEACLTARRRVLLSPWHPSQQPEGPWATATTPCGAKAP